MAGNRSSTSEAPGSWKRKVDPLDTTPSPEAMQLAPDGLQGLTAVTTSRTTVQVNIQPEDSRGSKLLTWSEPKPFPRLRQGREP